ncbi:Ig-like domain-containing protein [Duffyella gerundensis]|uniref:Ig-like domain-containing protein n=1 Tax=Duffyella gerundensis TaxID=1619313 RepID=UPI003F6DDCD1
MQDSKIHANTDERNARSLLTNTIPAPVITEVISDSGSKRGPIAENTYTDDPMPLIKGTALPGSLITFYSMGFKIGEGYANEKGEFSIVASTPLPAGHQMLVAVASVGENSSPGSNVFTFGYSPIEHPVDGNQPVNPQPVLTTPVIEGVYDNRDGEKLIEDGISADTTPVLKGSSDPFTLIYIMNRANLPIASVMTNSEGKWEVELPPIRYGDFYAVAVDPQDPTSISYKSEFITFQVEADPITPEPPEETFVAPYAERAIADEYGNVSLSDGDATKDYTPRLQGVAGKNATVIIRLNGEVIAEVQANAQGKWEYPSAPLSKPGENVFTFASTDSNGQEQISAQSFTLQLTLSSRIDYMFDDAGFETGALASGTYTDDDRPTLHGTGTPLAIVTIYSERGPVGSVQINENGEWQFTPESALQPGVHRFRPVVSHPDVEVPVGGAFFEVGILTPASLMPEINYVRDDEGYNSWLDNGATTDDATPTFTGFADAPGMQMVVRDNGNVVGYVTVGRYGDWEYTPQPALQTGSHSFTFEIVDSAGKVHATAPYVLHVVPPVSTTILFADDDVGDVTDRLQSGARTDDAQPTFHGTGTPNATVNIYYKNYYYLGSAKINADGEWTFTPREPLPAGSYDFYVRELDAYGSLQPPSANFTLDIAPPVNYFAPTVGSVIDNANNFTYLNSGQMTDDATPAFSGRGMPNSKILVRDNNQQIAEIEVNQDGRWSFTPSSDLQTGQHSFTFVTVAENGQEHSSQPFTLNVITQIHGRIESAEDNVGDITGSLTSGARTDDATPTLKGVGSPNGVVNIYDGNRYLGSVEINANGEWSFTPDTPLSAGTHRFVAQVTGPDGSYLPASPAFELIIAPPVNYFAPTITSVYDNEYRQGYLINDAITDDATPRFSGRGMPNTKIEVRLDGEKIGEANVNAYGQWNFTPSSALSSGKHNFSFVTVGEKGQEFASDDFALEIITQVNGRIDMAVDNVGDETGALASGARTDDTTPTLHGVGTPNGTVTIYDRWVPVGSAKIGADGKWSFTPGSALSTGSHSFHATVTGPDGTSLANSPAFNLTIAPPVNYYAPTITSVYDDQGRQGSLNSGAITDDATPRFSGRGMPNTKIEVRVDGEKIGEANVNILGQWNFTPSSALPSGNHTFTFVTVDTKGQEFASDDFALEIITQIPGRIEMAVDNVGDETGALASGARTDDTTPTLHGVGTPNGTVTIYDRWVPVGSAKIGADGKWSFTPGSALSTGSHSFHATVTGPDGTSLANSPAFNLTIAPPVNYYAPTITSVYDDQGKHSYLNSGALTDDTTPRFSGRGMPNTKIEVRVDGEKVGEVNVNAYGQWNFTPSSALPSGNHTFTFVTVGAKGQEFASDDFALEIITQVNGRIEMAVDNVGDETGALASGARTDDTTPTLHGVGTPNGTVTIYDRWMPLGSAKIGADGKWSFTPGSALSQGSHSFHVIAVGPDGTSLPNSPSFNLTITPPVNYFAPTVASVEDNQGNQGYLGNGAITDDTTPGFSGRGMPNTTIEVRLNGEKIGNANVNSMGQWSFTPSSALPSGNHSFTFVTVGAKGQEFVSEAFNLQIITHVEGVIQFAEDDVGSSTAPLFNGDLTDDTMPTLRGVGTPGGSVEIFLDGLTMITLNINDKGEWSYPLTSALSNGTHEFYAVVTSPDGTKLPAGPTFSLSVDTPVEYFAPVIEGVVDNVKDTALLVDGDTTDDATPGFVGKAMADSLIAVYINDEFVEYVKADPWGVWSYTPLVPLAKGEYTFSFGITDNKGDELRSEALTLHIDPPMAQTILFAEDDVGPETGLVMHGGNTDDTQPTFSGTGTPGSLLFLFNQHAMVGSVEIGQDGKWSLTPDWPLAPGQHILTALVMDQDGYQHPITSPFHLTILGENAFQTPVIEGMYNDDTNEMIAHGGNSSDTTPLMLGTGETGSTVRIHDSGTGETVETTVNLSGYWTWTPEAPLNPGEHTFTVTGIDEEGNEHAGTEHDGSSYTVNILRSTDNSMLSYVSDELDASQLVAVDELLQDGNSLLFAEPESAVRASQPEEPTAFVSASEPLVKEWETTTNHY